MRMEIEQHLESIKALCEKHRVAELYLFGSALGGNFDPKRSDADFIVEFKPFPRGGFDDPYFRLKHDLEDLLDRPVDLIEAKAIRNPYFREEAEETRKIIYAA